MRHTLRLYLKMRERVAEEDDVEVGVNDREASNKRVEDHLRANVHLADDSELSVRLAGRTPSSPFVLRTNSELYVHLADQLRALCPSCGTNSVLCVRHCGRTLRSLFILRIKSELR